MKKPSLPYETIVAIIQRHADRAGIVASQLFTDPLPRHRRDLLPRVRRDIMAELYSSGMPACRIANLFRISWPTVSSHLKKSGCGYVGRQRKKIANAH